MARKSGVLIRQLFDNCSSNPCAGLLHHSRKLLSNSVQTLTLSSIPSRIKSSYLACKLPLSSPHLHFVKREDSGLVFSSPSNMVIISNLDDYKRAVKEVEDGLLPAVFFFIGHKYNPMWALVVGTLIDLRQRFPHVTFYKVINIPVTNMEATLERMMPDPRPIFHCYKNGGKVAEIRLHELTKIFAKLYRYVVPVETTQPTSSSGMGERRAEQLVVRAKKDENDKGVVGALSQRRGAATLSEQRGGLVEAVESSTAPSLHEVMQAVESLPGGRFDSHLWWYARGLFTYQPKKRVMFSNVQGPYFKVAWLLHEMAEE